MAVSAIPEAASCHDRGIVAFYRAHVKRNVIVRKLTVESLGSCTVIASDKTGTLTVNQQTVRAVLFPDGLRASVSGQGYNDEGVIDVLNQENTRPIDRERIIALGKLAALCNEGSLEPSDGNWIHSGDAMDIALLAFARKAGLDMEALQKEYIKTSEIPYESENRFAATAYQHNGKTLLIAKGAVEKVMEFCDTASNAEGEKTLRKEKTLQQALSLAEEGYRVLAFASREIVDGKPIKDLMKVI